MIKRTICIKNYQDRSTTGDTWSLITGTTTGGTVEYYTGQTSSDAYIGKICILLTQNIDDIGYFSPILAEWKKNTKYNIGNYILYGDNTYRCIIPHTSGLSFTGETYYWKITPEALTGATVSLEGESKINAFRRYGKNDKDVDLYNPDWNTGYTYSFKSSDGNKYQLTGIKDKSDPFSYQPLYEYKIWSEENSGSTIYYSDIGGKSNINFISSGLTSNNSIETQNVKIGYLIGVIDSPKIDIDVFIDRGLNTFFERHFKLAEVKSFYDLENYGNGYFKIREN